MVRINGIHCNGELASSLRHLPALPSYPTNSLEFLQRLQLRAENTAAQSAIALNIIIVGAGLGGLATACALARRGHHVTVFEQANQLGEVGAGIQMPPNSAHLLLKWGIGEFLQEKVVEPTSVKFRRWKNGAEIGCTRLFPEHRQKFNAPYYVVHRAHFHDALHRLALKLGAKVEIDAKVQEYDPEIPSITLANGQTYTADLIVAADGIKSTARKVVVGDNIPPRKTGFAAYRATVDVDKIKADPNIAWVVEQPNINLWIGSGRHAMTYPIASGESFNMVLSHPQSSDECAQSLPEILDEMRKNFEGWDDRLTKIISLIHTTMKWPLYNLPRISTYLHPSSKLILLGDSAHAMLPYMSQGAAMAVEDGAALAHALHLATSRKEVERMLKIWNDARVQRCSQMQEASSINGVLWHFQDGPEQEARDAAMRWEVADGESIDQPYAGSSPNQWSDVLTSTWCFGYDAEKEIQRRIQFSKL